MADYASLLPALATLHVHGRVRGRIAIDAVAALARHKSLNVAQKYARKADQLKRAPSKNPALAI